MPVNDSRNALKSTLDPKLFKALGEANRCQLLTELACCGQTLTLGQAAACCAVDLSVVSRHLGILESAGLVRVKRQGREKHFTLQARELASALRSLADALEASPCQCAAETEGG